MESLRILGIVGFPTSFESVKTAYRKKISQYHPDRFAGEPPEVLRYAEETAKNLNTAYSILEKHYRAVS